MIPAQGGIGRLTVSKKHLSTFLMLILIIIVFSITVYPTLYYYGHTSDNNGRDILVKINRVTGHTETLYATGWIDIEATYGEH
jgi:CHASE3 domain sensor protein